MVIPPAPLIPLVAAFEVKLAEPLRLMPLAVVTPPVNVTVVLLPLAEMPPVVDSAPDKVVVPPPLSVMLA
jgi:hypothetical protein